MVADRAVVLACVHAAILEICAQTRTDMGLSVLASRIVPCQSEPLGKPRLTLVSDGNPLRRLLLRSKKNSVFTALSPFGWICPSHPEGEAAFAIVAYLDVVVESDYSLASLRWIVVEKSPLHSSYERGCQAKTLLHSSRYLDRCLHPGPFFVERILGLMPGAQHSTTDVDRGC